jgi:hypothetical protein
LQEFVEAGDRYTFKASHSVRLDLALSANFGLNILALRTKMQNHHLCSENEMAIQQVAALLVDSFKHGQAHGLI